MAYITYTQYVAFYGTLVISEAEFPMYAGAASDLIDAATQYRIVNAGGIDRLPEGIQALVRKACAIQILYLIQNGFETVLSGQTGQNFTVGKVSINGGLADSGKLTGAQLIMCPAAKALLEQTGLMYRGMSTLGYDTARRWTLC